MPVADAFYYLRNFQTLIDTLVARDGDLLDLDERRFIEQFGLLPRHSQALLVRMVMRRGDLFRASRLRYAEIVDVVAAMRPLMDHGWVDPRSMLTLPELFRLLTKHELLCSFGLPRPHAHKKKAQLLEELGETFAEPRTFDGWCDAPIDTVYRVTIDGVCERLRLMFFGNFRQDLTEFVLADLGVFKYEHVALHAGSRPFRTRAQVDAFHRIYRCRQLLHAGLDPTEIEPLVPRRVLDCDWLEERREKLRFQLARVLERQGSVREAGAIYADCGHPQARVRAARLEAALGGVARRRPPRRSASAPEFRLTLPQSPVGRSVEWSVLEHLATSAGEATSVHYVENGLINSLFGLLCWPAVFAPVPGAFFHAFHHGPADITSARFLERREAEFGRCFEELRCGSYKDTMRRRYVEKAGTSSPFVAWSLVNEALLETSLACFPAAHLYRWFEWIVRDVRANRTGFPDLVQFWPATERYRLIEVKGPGDRLQDNQRRCLEYCLAHKMPVSVCHVTWADSPL